MRISGSSIQSVASNGLQSRDENRLQEQPVERARDNITETRQNQAQPQQSDVQISEAARQASSIQQVVPTSKSAASQPSYQYYRPVEPSTLSSSNQRALQAYSNTQQISREAQGSGEFLGGIDLFV